MSAMSVASTAAPTKASPLRRRICMSRNGWSSAKTTVKIATATKKAAPFRCTPSRSAAATIRPIALAAAATAMRTSRRITPAPYSTAPTAEAASSTSSSSL